MEHVLHTVKAARIHNRSERCLCGCKGQDAWHKRSFKRNVQVTSERMEVSSASKGEFTWVVLRRGVAQLPWGKQAVHQTGILDNRNGGKVTELGWKVTR